MSKSPKKRLIKNDEDNTSQGGDYFEQESSQSVIRKSLSKKQNKLRHFPNLPDEVVLKRVNCALVSDFLRQGILYVTKNYFAFYSNIFGYITKLLIPVLSVKEITKEKTVLIIPNAIGIATSEQKHVFTSISQRDATYEILLKVWDEANSENNDFDMYSGSDSESIYSTEDDLNDNDDEDLQPPKVVGSEAKKKKRYHLFDFVWYLAIVVIVLLFLTSGILVYRILSSQSVLSRGKELYPENMKGGLKSDPNLLSKAYLSINEFVDRKVTTVSEVRKSLEVLEKMLDNKN